MMRRKEGELYPEVVLGTRWIDCPFSGGTCQHELLIVCVVSNTRIGFALHERKVFAWEEDRWKVFMGQLDR